MNRTLIAWATSLALASTAIAALTGERLSALKEKLANSDPAVRRQGLEELIKEKPQTAGNDIVPLLSSALSDQDAQVRALAAGTLAMISLSTSPKFTQPNAKATDLKSYAPLQAALVTAFNDPDEEMRKNALAAYALTFKVPPAVQDTLASRYDAERPNSLFRTAILEALTIDGEPTPAAKALLVRVADDPKSSIQLAQVIKDSKASPVELLPYFASQFNSVRDSNERALFARAIGKFGSSAKPYVSVLQRAADTESDDAAKQTITSAVAAINAAH